MTMATKKKSLSTRRTTQTNTGKERADLHTGAGKSGSNITEFRLDNVSQISRLFGQPSVRRPYGSVVLVYACVAAIAEAAASAPFMVINDKGEQDLKSPYTSLFQKPNPCMDQPSEFWEAHASWISMRGECIWYLEYAAADGKKKRKDEVPESIWPFPPDYFTPVVVPGDPVPKGWRMTIPGQGYTMLDPEQVVQFKTFNPEDMLRGLDKVRLLRRTLVNLDRSKTFNEKFFDNNAEPGGILSTEDPLTMDQADELQRKWEDRHKGQGKESRVAVLSNGLKYTPLAMTHQEMQFLEQQKWNSDEIHTAFGVNRAILGMVDGLTYANAREARKIFWENNIIPKLVKWANTVNIHFKVQCRFELANIDVLTVGLQDKINAASGLQRLGYTLNQASKRVNLGMPDVDWGDVPPYALYSVDENVAAAVLLASIKDPVIAGRAARLLSLGRAPAKQVLELSGPTIVTSSTRENNDNQRHRETNAVYIKEVLDKTEHRFQNMFAQYINALFVEQLKRIDSAKGVSHKGLRHLVSRSVVKDIEDPDSVLIDLEVWQKKLVTKARPLYTDVVGDSLSVAADLTGGAALGVNNPRIVEFMREKEIKVADVTDRVRDNIRAAIVEGLQNDESVADIKARLQALKDFTKDPVRTLRVARTETAQAASGARFIQFDADGAKKKGWSSSGDDHVRDDHLAFEALGDVEFEFDYITEASDDSDGELQYPGDINGPASQVINCRCSLLPG